MAKDVDNFNRQLAQDKEGSDLSYVEISDNFISSIGHHGESLKRLVITLAGQGHFEAAKMELRHYQEAHEKTPGFRQRTHHYFNHCVELLDAIHNLKNFPNFSTLRAAQQKQIRERIVAYAEDLSSILGRIDKVDNDLKIQDMRSTIWVVRAAMISIGSIVIGAGVIELLQTVPTPVNVIARETLELILKVSKQ